MTNYHANNLMLICNDILTIIKMLSHKLSLKEGIFLVRKSLKLVVLIGNIFIWHSYMILVKAPFSVIHAITIPLT